MGRWTEEMVANHQAWKTREVARPADNFEFVDIGVGTLRVDQPVPYESDVQAAVLQALRHCDKVAWYERINTGGMVNPNGQYVRFGFKGCADILGQMTDGRFLAIECKRPGQVPTEEQQAFLGRVQRAGGVAFVAWSVDDVAKGLA